MMNRIKMYYSIIDLKRMFGRCYETTKQTMLKAGIPASKVGNTTVFYISDIEDNAPSIYRAIVKYLEYNTDAEAEDGIYIPDHKRYEGRKLRTFALKDRKADEPIPGGTRIKFTK